MSDPGDGLLGDLYTDVHEVRRVLDSFSPPVLLCGHSYGGAVITEGAAGPHLAVSHLVYLAGAVPDINESMASFAPAAHDDGQPQENAASEGPRSLARPARSCCRQIRPATGCSTTARRTGRVTVRTSSAR